MKDQARILEDEAYQLLGRLAVGFASLEYMVALILDVLVNPRCPITGGLLLGKADLRAKLCALEKLIHLRHPHQCRFVEPFLNFKKKADKLYEKRNLFIHGHWDLSSVNLKRGRLVCKDPLWELDTKQFGQHRWDRNKEHEYPIKDLRMVIKKCETLIKEAECLRGIIRKEPQIKNVSTRLRS